MRINRVLEGSDFLVVSEKKPSAFDISSNFRLEPTELTPHHTRIVSEGLGALHAAERLLHKRSYRDSGGDVDGRKIELCLE